jgi:hypothetical protein
MINKKLFLTQVGFVHAIHPVGTIRGALAPLIDIRIGSKPFAFNVITANRAARMEMIALARYLLPALVCTGYLKIRRHFRGSAGKIVV